MNQLGAALSPYLRQHAGNPVHWREWSAAALADARSTDRPILLSVGYAACHWCHVMAHESFEDDGVAELLNEHFVPIKVDREERPDIDAVYMTATQAMTGQGGWPMTCVLTPEGEPVWAGTYLPRSALMDLLGQVAELWRTRRAQVRQQGAEIAAALRRYAAAASAGGALDDSASDPTEGSTDSADTAAGGSTDDATGGSTDDGVAGSVTGSVVGPVVGARADSASRPALQADELDAAVAMLGRRFDSESGGFGGAPKFPPSMVLEFLLRQHARTNDPDALAMAERTFEAMARGGLFDQLAGGFARYSVDRHWVVPHFEKMLYDNALLLRGYLHLLRANGSALAARVARETAEFMLGDLRTDEGMFASSLDADAAGVEGSSYVWTPAQLVDVLGDQDGAAAAELLCVTASGTFEQGASTLQLPRVPADERWWLDTRRRLLAARNQRPQPDRDDKIVTAWNGLAIAALAEGGVLLADQRLLEAASRCAEQLLAAHLVDGRLRRVSLAGVAGEAAAVAEDYGNLADGLLALFQATGQARWLTAAGELLDTALTIFADDAGDLHDTAVDAEPLLFRPRSTSDNAEPSGASSLAGALVGYAALTGSSQHREAAATAVSTGVAVARQDPRFAGQFLSVAQAMLVGPVQVAIVGEDEQARRALTEVARRSCSPGLVLATGRPDDPGIPLLADRPMRGGAATAYVCRGFVCAAPVTEPEELAIQLARGRAG